VTDFLTRLAERVMGVGRVVHPVLPSRYAPDVSGLQQEAPETEDDSALELELPPPPTSSVNRRDGLDRVRIDPVPQRVAASAARPAPRATTAATPPLLEARRDDSPPPAAAPSRPSRTIAAERLASAAASRAPGGEQGTAGRAVGATPMPARGESPPARRPPDRISPSATDEPRSAGPPSGPGQTVSAAAGEPSASGSRPVAAAVASDRSRPTDKAWRRSSTPPDAEAFLVAPAPRPDSPVHGPRHDTPRPTPPALVAPRPQPAFPASPGPRAAAPTVRVTIGRIEVRAVAPPAPPILPPAPQSTQPTLSLDDYLRVRRGASR